MPGAKWIANFLSTKPFLKGFLRGHQDLFYGFKMLFDPNQRPTEEYFLKLVKTVEEEDCFSDILLGVWQSLTNSAVAHYSNERRYDEEGKRKLYDESYAFAKEKNKSFHAIAAKTGEYDFNSGPFYWKFVVDKKDQIDPHGFLVNNYFPVFTFSSAPHGRGLQGNFFPFDCYVILHVLGAYETWRLNVYEYVLPHDRNNKYVSIEYAQSSINKDPLKIRWTDEPTKKCCPAMIK